MWFYKCVHKLPLFLLVFVTLRSHATDNYSQVHGNGGQMTIKATCNDGYCLQFYKLHSQTRRRLIGSTRSDQVEIHLSAKRPCIKHAKNLGHIGMLIINIQRWQKAHGEEWHCDHQHKQLHDHLRYHLKSYMVGLHANIGLWA